MVNMENYEEYLMLYADGELSMEERHELEAFIAAHPALQSELDMLAAVKIIPETEIVFEHKEQLLKKETRTISLNRWWAYGAAAGIIALITITLMKQPAPETIAINEKQPAKQVQPPVIKQPAVQPIETEAINEPQIAGAEPTGKSKGAPPVVKEKEVKPEEPVQFVAEVKQLEMVSPQQKTLKAEEAELQPLSEVELPAIAKTKEVPFSNQSQTLPSWLPVEEERLSGVLDFTAAVNINLDKAREIKENIKNSDVTFKIGNKELFVVRL